MTLTRGKAVNGGAIRLREDVRVTVEQVTFSGNSATGGAAIATMSESSTATISDSSFLRNVGQENGGAIQAMRGAVTISSSNFDQNRARGSGGALHTDYGSFDVTNSTFRQNSAASGGAVRIYFGQATLTHVTMVHNEATQNNGDAIDRLDGRVLSAQQHYIQLLRSGGLRGWIGAKQRQFEPGRFMRGQGGR